MKTKIFMLSTLLGVITLCIVLGFEHPVKGNPHVFGKYANAREVLILYENKSYEYNYEAFPAHAFSEGRWTLDDSVIFLSSSIQIDDLSLEVDEFTDSSKKELAFIMSDHEGNFEPFIEVEINGNPELIYFDPVINDSFPSIVVKELSYFFVTYANPNWPFRLSSKPYFPANPDANRFIILLKIPEGKGYHFFDSVPIFKKNRELCFRKENYGLGFAPKEERCLSK